MSRTTSSPSRAFNCSVIPFLRKFSCCIHGALETATVRIPSLKLTGLALPAIWGPTAESQTSQTFPSFRRFSVGVPRKTAARRSATLEGPGIFSLLSAIAFSLFVDDPPQQLPGHGAAQRQGDEFPAVSEFHPQEDDYRNGNVYIKVPAE